MWFEFDHRKSRRLRNNPKRGIGFDEAREILSHPYYEDYRSDDPAQFRMKRPIQRVNVDFTVEMLHELDAVASELNISRQAVSPARAPPVFGCIGSVRSASHQCSLLGPSTRLLNARRDMGFDPSYSHDRLRL